LIEKEVATVEEVDACLIKQLEQPALGNWYNMMHQLYAYRVHETLQIQKDKREAGEEDKIQQVADINVIPSGPPDAKVLKGGVQITQTED